MTYDCSALEESEGRRNPSRVVLSSAKVCRRSGQKGQEEKCDYSYDENCDYEPVPFHLSDKGEQ